MKTIIEMAIEAGVPCNSNWAEQYLEAFAKLVRADERDRAMRENAYVLAEREACAEKTGEFARKWWSIHCASNKHMETTRKAHDDFCALQAAIRARGNT
jgi:hypothetical protein